MGQVIFFPNDNLCNDCVYRRGTYCINEDYIKHHEELKDKGYCVYKEQAKKGIKKFFNR